MSEERISWIDAVRGVAMMGIMTVNLPSMNTLAGEEAVKYGFMRTSTDQIVGQLNMSLLNGKCYPIFAFLFGLGLAIFMDAAKKKSLNPYKYALKRLGILFIFGILHLLLVWWGDILLIYAALGTILVWFYPVSPRKTLLTSLLLLVGVPVLCAAISLLSFNPILNFNLFNGDIDVNAIHSVYAHGSYWDIASQRITDYMRTLLHFLANGADLQSIFGSGTYYSQLLGLHLLGFWIAKTRLHQSIRAHLVELRKVLYSCLILAVLTAFFRADSSIRLLNNTTLSVSYLCIFALAYHSKAGKVVLNLFIPVGRMSLTAYFAHTITFSMLLYGPGLGLYGQVGPAFLLGVSLFFYTTVAVFCYLWLKTFSQGPMEWIWRRGVYGNYPMEYALPASSEPFPQLR